MVKMIVLLSFLHMVLNKFMMEKAVNESSPEVGSSNMIHFGSLTNS